jgi:hypothetical protein
MKTLSLIGILIVFLCSSVQAACPDIVGKWIYNGDSLELGDRFQGVGVATFKKEGGSSTVNKVALSEYVASIGVQYYEKYTGKVTINSSCKVTISEDDGPTWSGYIVNKDKMFFIGNSSAEGSSFKVLMERQDLTL